MLSNVRVKNMALIKEADFTLGEGLNILSGETGAGKSILLGAVCVALCLKSFRGFAREDAGDALAQLIFTVDSAALQGQLRELGIPVEDDQLIITRRQSNGRAVSRINGETVPASLVKKAAALLLDIHGQHENQTLLYKKKHLEILDNFAGDALTDVRRAYEEQYRTYQALKEKLAQARRDDADRAREMDFLSCEIKEIEAAAPVPGEDVRLEEAYQMLSNGRAIAECVSSAYQMTGPEGASAATGRALQSLADVAGYDRRLEELYGQLLDADSLLNDFNRELSGYADSLELDEETLYQTEERLDLLNRLKAKYGGSIEKVLARQKECQERLDLLTDYETYLSSVEQEFEACAAGVRTLAEQLSGLRREAAGRFADRVCQNLRDLNFLDVRFEVEVQTLAAYTESGKEEVCFQISTNPGQPLRPVQDMASGGELSRIMLAIKAVMADREQVGTLLFDEIDSGISGRTAQKVSEKLSLIAESRQVICITHLAQIAAMADVHILIEKSVEDGDTSTRIHRLNQEESIRELARILGGAQITETVLHSAREMKELARRTKRGMLCRDESEGAGESFVS